MGASSLLYFLLFLLLLLDSQGFKSAFKKKSHGQESSLNRTSIETASQIIPCNGGHCSGKHSKLARFTTISPFAVPKSQKDENRGGMRWKATSEARKRGGGREKVKEGSAKAQTDVGGIAEMDYSPARRKTPIHN